MMRQARVGISVGATGGTSLRILVGLVAIAAVCYVVLLLPGDESSKVGDLATGPVGTTTTTTTASVPATTSAPATATAPKWTPPRFKARRAERDAMVRIIRAYSLRDKSVLEVMAAVPRHEFVPSKYSRRAYADTPLPIGFGQTISQPYMVAEMTRLLKLTPKSRVLEIGTGSGYQAAVLAHFTPHVYSIEIVKPLAESARKRLKRLGYGVVKVRAGDGYYGWSKKVRFDAIIVTCAAGRIPPPLIRQLAPGGRMVIPVGRPFAMQSLMLLEKQADGSIRSKSLMGVAFVPMTGQVGKK